MPDKNDFSELIADLLRGQDRLNAQMEDLRKENKDNADRTINAFNHFAEAVLKKLDSVDTKLTKMDEQLSKIADMDERLKRLEAEVFKK
jgi:uncharacterized protein involved in exopolysaccharide biosynthesis